jgi:hypothetical protein
VYVSLLLPQGATASRLIPFDIQGILLSPSLCPYYPLTFASASILCFDSVRAGETQTQMLTIMPSIRSPGTLRTDAVVEAYTPDGNLANNRGALETPVELFEPAAGIDLRLTFDSVPALSAGKPLLVPFRLLNLGLGDARSITVSATTEPRIESLSFGLSVQDTFECSSTLGGSIECKFDELPSDAHLAGDLFAESAPAGTYTATVTVTSPDLPAPVTATTTFQVK